MARKPRKYSITDIPPHNVIELAGCGKYHRAPYNPRSLEDYRGACMKIHKQAMKLIEHHPDDKVIFQVFNLRTNQRWIWTG